MARNAKEEMAWKPRRLRKQDIEARVAHLQKNLPPVVREVFGADDARLGVETAAVANEAKQPAAPKKKSKFAVLLWEPRES